MINKIERKKKFFYFLFFLYKLYYKRLIIRQQQWEFQNRHHHYPRSTFYVRHMIDTVDKFISHMLYIWKREKIIRLELYVAFICQLDELTWANFSSSPWLYLVLILKCLVGLNHSLSTYLDLKCKVCFVKKDTKHSSNTLLGLVSFLRNRR